MFPADSPEGVTCLLLLTESLSMICFKTVKEQSAEELFRLSFTDLAHSDSKTLMARLKTFPQRKIPKNMTECTRFVTLVYQAVLKSKARMDRAPDFFF